MSDGSAKPSFRKRLLFRLLGWYPPYLGAGINVTGVSPDLLTLDVRLRLSFWNRNYVGTQFGGSLYSMCDPFYMLILIEALGPGYVVWDKAAAIRFRRPGRGPVRARFHVPPERVEEIRRQVAQEGKAEPVFEVEVLDQQDQVVAQVEKVLQVRRRELPEGR